MRRNRHNQKITMTVDENEFLFKGPTVRISGYEHISSGLGIIEVKAHTKIKLTSSAKHILSFKVAYQEFSNEWFVQSFFYSNKNEVIPCESVNRSKTDDHMKISFSP